MNKVVVATCVKTSEFANGFDVDFKLLGDERTYHGRLYEKHDEDGKYSMAVFMEKGFEKYGSEPQSEVTDQIAEQIINLLNKDEEYMDLTGEDLKKAGLK